MPDGMMENDKFPVIPLLHQPRKQLDGNHDEDISKSSNY